MLIAIKSKKLEDATYIERPRDSTVAGYMKGCKTEETENLNDILGSRNKVRFIIIWETTVLQVEWVQQRILITRCNFALNST